MLQEIDESKLSAAGDHATLAYFRAQMAQLQGNLPEARQYCEQAINLDPQGDAPFYREFLQSLDQNPGA
jgi:hypothetical protein